jgi:hypothetical protein
MVLVQHKDLPPDVWQARSADHAPVLLLEELRIEDDLPSSTPHGM